MLPAELVVTMATPGMVLPTEFVVVTSLLDLLALAEPELADAAVVTAARVLVKLVRVLPAELVVSPVTPTMVLPEASVVVTAPRVPVVVTLPLESTEMRGAPGIPVLATPRSALMAD